jgi:hypothetical protein
VLLVRLREVLVLRLSNFNNSIICAITSDSAREANKSFVVSSLSGRMIAIIGLRTSNKKYHFTIHPKIVSG